MSDTIKEKLIAEFINAEYGKLDREIWQSEMKHDFDLIKKALNHIELANEANTSTKPNALLADVSRCNLQDWKDVETEMPITYETGDWDGKRSDEVVVEDNNGKKHVARLYEGFMDGSAFSEWFENDDWAINEPVRWLSLS